LRKQTKQKGKWACQIICVNTEKFASQRTREGIEQVGISLYKVAERFKEPNVLTVQIQYENTAVSKGMQSLGEIYKINQHNGQQHGKAQVAVFLKKGLIIKLPPITRLLKQTS
jgi:hypothetical protein